MRPETAQLMRPKELVALDALTSIVSSFPRKIYGVEHAQRIFGLFQFSLPTYIMEFFEDDVRTNPAKKKKYEVLLDETRPRAEGEKESGLMRKLPRLRRRSDKERKRLRWLATLDWYKDQKVMHEQLQECKKSMVVAYKLLHTLRDRIQILKDRQSALYNLKHHLETRSGGQVSSDDPSIGPGHERYAEYKAWILRLPQARQMVSNLGYSEDEAMSELMSIDEESFPFTDEDVAVCSIQSVDVEFEDPEEEEDEEDREGMQKAPRSLAGISEESKWYCVEEIRAAWALQARIGGGAIAFR